MPEIQPYKCVYPTYRANDWLKTGMRKLSGKDKHVRWMGLTDRWDEFAKVDKSGRGISGTAIPGAIFILTNSILDKVIVDVILLEWIRIIFLI
jgi:hypothetical protein